LLRGALDGTATSPPLVIGSSRFHGYSEERSEVEIGWTFLARSHWGGRYNGELKRLMLEIGGVLAPEPDAEGRLVYRIRRP
jgi:RimJ/RimL family protein N-acetyltransferase